MSKKIHQKCKLRSVKHYIATKHLPQQLSLWVHYGGPRGRAVVSASTFSDPFWSQKINWRNFAIALNDEAKMYLNDKNDVLKVFKYIAIECIMFKIKRVY